jgi:uncharacterized protein (DUF362 family)/Pyruvate/2-oxoacid:ferredoxin oxidoreductase delta subunit
MKHKVALTKCGSYERAEVEEAVRRSVDLLGGIRAFVNPGEKVLIKPNLLTDAVPEEGIDTHPEVVRAVIRLLKTATPHLYCGDSPSVMGERKDVQKVYEASGMAQVCREEGVEAVYFTAPKMVKGHPLAQWAFDCDRLVNVPKFKTHGLAVLTAGVKNLFGLLIGMYKMRAHRDRPRPRDLSRLLVDLYEIRQPELTVCDGIVAMEGEGPGSTGTLRKMGLIAAATDAVALDMILAALMGRDPLDIPTNREAVARGWGPADLSSIQLLGESLQSLAVSDFKLPKTSFLNSLPEWAIAVLKRFLLVRPEVDLLLCRRCGRCQKICPAGAIIVEKRGVRIDRRKCFLCLCCQEVCPYKAMRARKSLPLKLLTG